LGRTVKERFEGTLRDGTPVLVRPIRPSDKPLLLEGFRRLSEESRFRRFMAPITQLSDEQLRYLTELDGIDHFAWIALRADRPGEGMGVARYVRLKEEPEVAEAAITVVDQYQGRGLGTLLVGLLATRAWESGVSAFRAYVLEDNEPMRDLLSQMGATARFDSPGVLRVDVPLDPALLPDSPATRVLRAVASRALDARTRVSL
jgi:RimJ/RimL family protein N-acetyltransferase